MTTQTLMTADNIASARGFDTSLVALYNTKDLYELARDKSSKSRQKLIETLSGIFDSKLGFHELDIASDIVISLVKQAELDLRVTLAEQFSDNENLPLRLALTFANDEYLVAQPILEHSPVLNDLDLMYIIQAKSSEYWASIAKRTDLGAVTIQTLSDKRDEQTALSLLDNDKITLPEASCIVFMEMSKVSSALTKPLTQRTELPADIARELYNIVGDTLQKELSKRYGDITKEMALAKIVIDEKLAIKKSIETNLTPKDIPAARIIEALRLGQMHSFKSMFSAFTGLKSCMVDTLLNQKGGRGIAIICKARRMDRRDFMTLYMLKSSLTSENKLVDHKELSKALMHFDRIEMDFATKMHAKAMSASGSFSFT